MRYEDDSPKETRDSWHLDKRVPIAFIITILIQSGFGFWWAASTTEKVSILKERMDAISPQAERLARVEVSLEDIRMSLLEIKQALRLRPTPEELPNNNRRDR
jgi:Tfp pilus assembly protein PilO